MPKVSITLLKESNRRLATAKTNVVARSAKRSPETINRLMKKAFTRFTR